MNTSKKYHCWNIFSYSFSSKGFEKTKAPFEWLLTPDYPKRYLFQRGEVNTRCETNILNDFRRKRWRKAVGRELTFPMNRSLTSWKEEDYYFRSRGCTEIHNKTAPARLEPPLYSTPFTVHDLRGPNNTKSSPLLEVGVACSQEGLCSIVIPFNERYTSTSGPRPFLYRSLS